MNAHTRFALPMNTHGNLKHLHDKAQTHADNKTDNQAAESATAAEPRRDSFTSKLALKMKMPFSGKKKAQATQSTPQEDETERKRSTMSQLIGSHAFVQMGRR